MPQYSITREIRLDKVLSLVSSTNSKHPHTELSLRDFVLKAVHLTCLKVPSALEYYINDNLYKANFLVVKYTNFADSEQDKLLMLRSSGTLKNYKETNFAFTRPLSYFQIEDMGDLPVTNFKPIVEVNNVS